MEILILLILIFLNGFFALSEIALVSCRKSRLEQKRQEGVNGAKTALKLLENSESFLSAVQVGITLIGIVTGVYGGINIADDISPFFERIDVLRPYANEISLTLIVLIITYFSIVFGELVPKTIALSNPENLAVKVAPFIHFFSRVFYPFVKLLSFSTNMVNKILGVSKNPEHITEAELRQLIKSASVYGVIGKEQNIIHEKVFNFADKRAKHIMTHRRDVEWINLEQQVDKIKADLLKAQHSKVLCCNGNIDNFLGIIYLRDFYKSLYISGDNDIKSLILEPPIVPDNIYANKILEILRQKQVHLCCVVNEYGGFEGLITVHDILENIIGQIPDEGEIYEPDIFIRDDKSIFVSGDAPIEILSEIIPDFQIDFDQIDYSTVAGFVFNQINKIPQIGDKFVFRNYTFEIVDIDGNMIDKILIMKQ